MSHRASPIHSHKRDQQRYVQFSPTAPVTIPSSSYHAAHPAHAQLYGDDSYLQSVAAQQLQQQQQQQQHGAGGVHSDFLMDDMALEGYHSQQAVQPSQPPLAGDEDDVNATLRRVHTSPATHYAVNDPFGHQMLPMQQQRGVSVAQQAAASVAQQQSAYAAQLSKKAKQSELSTAAYDSVSAYYASGSGSTPSTPLSQAQSQSQQVQSILPARTLAPSGNSSNSLSSLSPSSSSSTLSSIQPSQQQQQPVSSQQAMAAAAAAALMEQGLRRIKSSPVALSSMVVSASLAGQAAAGGSVKRQRTAGASNSADTSAPTGRGTQQQKAQRRLARKAEAARASRRRKKAYVVGLEEKVAKLTAKLDALRNDQLSALKPVDRMSAVEAVHKEEQSAIKQRLVAILKEMRDEPVTGSAAMIVSDSVASTSAGSSSDSATPSNVTSPTLSSRSDGSPSSASVAEAPISRYDELKQLVDSFVSNSHKRQASVDLFFTQLEKTLIPSTAVKFALWGLSQPDDFYLNDGLWQGVMGREVGLSAAQLAEMSDCRSEVSDVVGELHDIMQRLTALRSEMKAHLDDRHKALEDVIGVLSSQQLAAFCLWVEQNPMCMQVSPPPAQQHNSQRCTRLTSMLTTTLLHSTCSPAHCVLSCCPVGRCWRLCGRRRVAELRSDGAGAGMLLAYQDVVYGASGRRCRLLSHV